MVKVNGKEMDIEGKTLSEYLSATDYDPKRIAVERNGDIVFKSRYAETVLNDILKFPLLVNILWDL